MPSRKPKARRNSSLSLVLPATSANLGPAFDAAALALSMFLKLRATVAPKFSIVAHGRDAAICQSLQDHLILTTYRQVLKSLGKPVRPLSLRIDNQIPIGKGCGSSAAARLAGIALAVHFGKLGWDDRRIVAEASRREHHPDNAAACWMGGLAVASTDANGDAHISRIKPKGKWPLLLAVPNEPLPTEEARKVLPQQYSRADAVTNLQHSMLLLAAFVQGRHDLLAVALQDRMHQPYRAALCPLLPALQDLPRGEGVIGAVLSGAGPSVLIFLDPRMSFARAERRLQRHLGKKGLSAELIPAAISQRGGRAAFRRS